MRIPSLSWYIASAPLESLIWSVQITVRPFSILRYLQTCLALKIAKCQLIALWDIGCLGPWLVQVRFVVCARELTVMEETQLVHCDGELIALHEHRHVVWIGASLLLWRYLALGCLTVIVQSIHGLYLFEIELLLVGWQGEVRWLCALSLPHIVESFRGFDSFVLGFEVRWTWLWLVFVCLLRLGWLFLLLVWVGYGSYLGRVHIACLGVHCTEGKPCVNGNGKVYLHLMCCWSEVFSC